MNPNTLQLFDNEYRRRVEEENELRRLEIDMTAWSIGRYVREAIVSAFNSQAQYPSEPLLVKQVREERMTPKDHANQFREYLKHYKRAPVKGGET